MGWLDRLFKGAQPPAAQPDIRFGRFSDYHKDAAQLEAWNQSLAAFEQGEFFNAYQLFFQYLRDEKEDNVKWQVQDGQLLFEVYQGSKCIRGFADNSNFHASVTVVKARDLQVPFMRRLLEQNFELRYCTWCMDDDNHLTLKFSSATIDASPYKLYYSLKELATKADKQDDLLLEEFGSLAQVASGHTQALQDAEVHVKYTYVQSAIQELFQKVERNSNALEQYPGAVSYLYLDTAYRLDYLIRPEGFTMELLENVHRAYFQTDQQQPHRSNQAMHSLFQSLQQRDLEAFRKEMYLVISTFGITQPTLHDRIQSFINNESSNLDWYLQNGFPDVAQAIAGYIAGYSLFNYALPEPDKAFFQLWFEIAEPEFFTALGFSHQYRDADGALNGKQIHRAIKAIEETNRKKYPECQPDLKMLDFKSLAHFAVTYCKMISQLNLTPAY